MKRLLLLMIVFSLGLFATGCGNNGNNNTQTTSGGSNSGADLSFDTVRIAFIHVGDPADMGYTYRQHRGTTTMMETLGVSEDQVMNFFNIPPGAAVDTSITEAIEWGANMIFGTSFAFEPHLMEAAREHPHINFFHATGNQALASGLPNFHNYFGNMAQARYISGIAAGLRTETNILGFVAAHPFAEVITGYTAFFLGARSVNPDVTMYVMYTNAWNNPTLENQVAQALIDRDADVIGQHADSTATQTVAEANGVWSVGYNNDMIPAAPNAVLTSPMFDWSIYLIYAVDTIVNGGVVRPDFLAGMEEGMVLMSPVNPNTVAPGTAEAMAAAEAEILAGRNVFTGPIYASTGEQLLAPGEEFIEPLSAPSWAYIVEGITIIE